MINNHTIYTYKKTNKMIYLGNLNLKLLFYMMGNEVNIQNTRKTLRYHHYNYYRKINLYTHIKTYKCDLFMTE